ncbi:MAG: hypothetical protein NDJ89_02690 [Oligoflexia bacterium]|nr:hypothetical protein [Oligoflexia bacterium]
MPALSLALAGMGAMPNLARAEVYHGGVTLAGQHFATDAAFSPRLGIEGEILSNESLAHDSRIRFGEFHLFSFFEGDANAGGDMSIDIDSTALRGNLSANGHFWFGRVHPLTEGDPRSAIRNTSAIGANWVQNQSNALDPRVSGWIGGGVHLKLADTGLFSTIGLSPIYLPSFGPRLTFSDEEDTRGSRFAKLPPLRYNYNGESFPMRYSIDTGSVADILLQPQYLLAFGHQSSYGRATGLFWSAPSPDPQVTTTGKLLVDAETGVNVMVNAVPSFPRLNHYGFRYEGTGLFARPELSIIQELRSHRLTLSAAIMPLPFLQLGWLDSPGPEAPPADPANGPVSARYAKNLLWGELTPAWKFSPTLRWERHLTEREQGFRLRQGFHFQASQNLTVAWSAEILAGEDGSYFGNWKSLDSVSLGARYQW